MRVTKSTRQGRDGRLVRLRTGRDAGPYLLRMLVLVFLCTANVIPASAQTTRERGLGPYTLETSRGEATVRLLRRDRDIIWVDRLVRSGEYIETGIPVKEIIQLKSPRPRLFELAEQAETDEQIKAVVDELRRMTAQLKPYRDIPGIPVNEALIYQAKLNEQRDYWRDALLIYEQLMNEPYDFPEKPMMRYWAGLDLWHMGQNEKALEYLMDDPVPDDDLVALSDILYARANCLSSAERYREAVETYLQLIVFYPFIQKNEVRALRGILPNYAELKEWDAIMKSIGALQRDYPDAPETTEAEEWLTKYAEQLEKEKQFQVLTD